MVEESYLTSVYSCATELPDYVLKIPVDLYSTSCTNIANPIQYYLYLSKCYNNGTTSFKYTLQHNEVIKREYTTTDCNESYKVTISSSTVDFKCDYCKQYTSYSEQQICNSNKNSEIIP